MFSFYFFILISSLYFEFYNLLQIYVYTMSFPKCHCIEGPPPIPSLIIELSFRYFKVAS